MQFTLNYCEATSIAVLVSITKLKRYNAFTTILENLPPKFVTKYDQLKMEVELK